MGFDFQPSAEKIKASYQSSFGYAGVSPLKGFIPVTGQPL